MKVCPIDYPATNQDCVNCRFLHECEETNIFKTELNECGVLLLHTPEVSIILDKYVEV